MFKKTSYTNDLEILYSPANLVCFSGTLIQGATVADENGKKYIVSGALIDATGKVVTQTGAVGSETLTTTPIGILYQTVDVTNGDEACSLVVEGYLRADRVLAGFAAKGITAIKTALPNIKFR
ncbi:MAG: hypothetical protein ACREV6_22050 [Clostridium sp.]|uniref:hypothetical protein n=1 Tax=Clostridium sp. TaxID=1506 RepID=UPI003D6D6FB5